MSLNPPWWVPQLLQCSNKSDRSSNRDRRDRDSLWRAMYCQEQLWLTNLPSPSVSIILLFASSNLSLSLRLSRTALVHANLSRGTHFLWNFFCFFLARGWNQCVRWTRNTNKKRRALTWENLQIAKHKSGRRSFSSADWFVLCDL